MVPSLRGEVLMVDPVCHRTTIDDTQWSHEKGSTGNRGSARQEMADIELVTLQRCKRGLR